MGVGWFCEKCGEEVQRGTTSETHAKVCDPTDRIDTEINELGERLEERLEATELAVASLEGQVEELRNAMRAAGIPVTEK